eukprot:1671997-Pyramimonas_sp.AAC.1
MQRCKGTFFFRAAGVARTVRSLRCKSASWSRRTGTREQRCFIQTRSAPFWPDRPCVFLWVLLASRGARKAVKEQ